MSPEFKAPGAVKDAQTGSISGKILEPHSVRAAYTFRIEILHDPQILSLPSSRSLTRAQGGGRCGNFEWCNRWAVRSFECADCSRRSHRCNSTFAASIALVASGVDGRHSRNLKECRLLVGSDSYQAIAAAFASNVAVSASDYLLERSGGLRASDLIPAKDRHLEYLKVPFLPRQLPGRMQ